MEKPFTPDIILAIGRGAKFAWAERLWLSYYAVWPIILGFAGLMLVAWYDVQHHVVWGTLALLPAALARSIYFFQSIRLYLLKQRINGLKDPAFQDPAVRANFRLSVGCYIGFDLGMTLVAFLVMTGAETFVSAGYFYTLTMVVLCLTAIWALRWFLLYIPAAVGYPLKQYLYEVRGMRFSVWVMMIMLMTSVPVFMVMSIIMSVALSVIGMDPKNPDMVDSAVYAAIWYSFIMVFFTIANFSCVDLLDQIIRKDKSEKKGE